MASRQLLAGVDELPPRGRPRHPVYARADAQPGRWFPCELHPGNATHVRRRGYDAAVRSGVLYVRARRSASAA